MIVEKPRRPSADEIKQSAKREARVVLAGLAVLCAWGLVRFLGVV